MNQVSFPWPPNILNPNRKVHWSKKSRAAKDYRETCFYLTKKHAKPEFKNGPIFLQVIFYPPDKRRRDDDNIIGAFKAGRDGMAQAWGVDDSRFRNTYTIGPAKIGGGVIVIF